MWTPTARRQHGRADLRHGSDLTAGEWAILSPFLPREAACGRKRAWPMREIANAICHVLRGGIAWRLMPDSFPPWLTVHCWFARLRDGGTWETISHNLVMREREQAGREASTPAAGVDSHSVKTTESGGPRGCDAGKKIKGRNRQAMVDTDGRALKLQVHAAGIQDRDGAGPLPRASRPRWPFVRTAFADSGYRRPRVAAASSIRVEIVRKSEGQVGFAVYARRWVVRRLDQPQPSSRQRRRSHYRLRRSLPLRRFRYPASAKTGSLIKRFETDSYEAVLAKGANRADGVQGYCREL